MESSCQVMLHMVHRYDEELMCQEWWQVLMERQVTLLPTQEFLLCEKDFESDETIFHLQMQMH